MNRLYFFLCAFQLVVQAGDRCLDNSFHADPCVTYDYKNYHTVKCSCRCQRYAHSLDRGMCRRCGHYQIPTEIKFKSIATKKSGRKVAATRSRLNANNLRGRSRAKQPVIIY